MPAPSPSKQAQKISGVLDAATRVFLAFGFNRATTDMIQREAGVSKSTLYDCFPNKQALFVAVIERQCATLAAEMQAIDAASPDLPRALRDIGASYLRTALSPMGLALFRMVVAEAPRFPELARSFYLAGPQAVTQLLAARLASAGRAGEVDLQTVGAEGAASLFVSMVRAQGQLEALTHPHAPPSAVQMDRWVDMAVAAFLRAFGVHGRSSR